MAIRKFMSEFGLNMMVDYLFILQQDHLNIFDDIGIEPHIYLIGRRPRIFLNPESLKITINRVIGEFRKQIKDNYVSIPFSVPNLLGTSDVELKCDYPFTEMALVNNNGKTISQGKCALILGMFGQAYWKYLDLEILYVGQAYGREGDRTAADRLRKHETLQGIYAKAMQQAPDQDIWLVLCTFKPLLLASFDGRTKNFATSSDQDNEHMANIYATEITEQQKINFTEASLIRYFQPEYNKTFKDTFPNPCMLHIQSVMILISIWLALNYKQRT